MKRLWRALEIAACLFAMGCGALAESALCIVAEDAALLLAMDGTELIPAGRYDDFYCLTEGERYAAGVRTDDGMRYALCDAQGRILTDAVYDMLYVDGESIIFRQNGKYGALAASGNEVLPAIYEQIVSNGEGAYLALDDDPNDDDPDEILYIVPGEEPVYTGNDTIGGLGRVSDGRMPFRSSQTERYGYVNAKGELAAEPYYTYAGEYSNGIARAAEEGRLGVLGADGAWKVAPQYDYLEIDKGVIVALAQGIGCVVFNESDCTELFRVEDAAIEVASINGYPLILKENQIVVYKPDGTILLEAGVEVSLAAGAGDQLILSDGDWGAKCVSVVYADGTRAERRDQQLLPLQTDRYAFLKMNVAAYNSDALGEIRYSCDYESIRYGMMDAAGNEILPAQYLEIRRLAENRFLAFAEDGLRLFDENGNILWQKIVEEEIS